MRSETQGFVNAVIVLGRTGPTTEADTSINVVAPNESTMMTRRSTAKLLLASPVGSWKLGPLAPVKLPKETSEFD